MREAVDYPPLWDEINKVFKIGKRKVIFAWGDTIYNPSGMAIAPQLWDHERVHGHRQGSDVEGWWRRYMEDPVFRLNEEIPAHIAEYEYMNRSGTRNERRMALKLVAGRLADPLYGRIISPAKARKLLVASRL